MTTGTVSIVVVLCVVATTITESLGVPSVTFYDARTIESSTFNFQTNVDRPDLAATWKYLPSNNVRVICQTGIWAFYWGVENYGVGPVFPTELHLDRCDMHVRDAFAGSVRFVGEVGKSRLNIYSGPSFTENGTYYETDENYLSLFFESVILVGNTPVQLYRGGNYDGTSYCLMNGEEYHAFHIATIGLKPGDIQSIRFGCNSDAVQIKYSRAQQSTQNTTQKD